MLFGKKKTSGSVFATHYKEGLKIARKSSIVHNAEYELLPAMFIVSDYAAASSGKDRRALAAIVMKEINLITGNLDKARFDKRCELYGEIIRGKGLRCEWFMGDHKIFNDNAVSKCLALFGDIIYNPECAENYDHTPLIVRSIFDTMTFTEDVMMPLMNEFMVLFNDIYRL